MAMIPHSLIAVNNHGVVDFTQLLDACVNNVYYSTLTTFFSDGMIMINTRIGQFECVRTQTSNLSNNKSPFMNHVMIINIFRRNNKYSDDLILDIMHNME